MITYAPLFQTLHLKKKQRTDLLKGANISSGTLAKLGKDEKVSLDVIDRICDYLECEIQEVMKHTPAPKKPTDSVKEE